MSMLLSPAWKELSANQQRLYFYCKAQEYSEHTKPTTEDFPFGNELYFTMNKTKWNNLYGLYGTNNQDGFMRDRDALIKFGFIGVVENGYKTKTIYRFRSAWTRYGLPSFRVTAQDASNSMLHAIRKAKSDLKAKKISKDEYNEVISRVGITLQDD